MKLLLLAAVLVGKAADEKTRMLPKLWSTRGWEEFFGEKI
jgi:hypothetical protein